VANATVEFLRDIRHGGDAGQPQRMAGLLGDFLAAAKQTLDIAIYDCRLDPPLDSPVVTAINSAASRGVRVRIAYDDGKPAAQTTTAFAAVGGDPAPVGTAQWLRDHFDGTSVMLQPIVATSGHLMHHKCVIRDNESAKPAVWTGSANWTNDAFTLQENNVIQVTSRKLATGYSKDFSELWTARAIKGTGGDADGHTTVDGQPVEWSFGPADGPGIDAHLVDLISAARRDVAVASMVLTSAAIIGALHDAIERGVNVHGVYDRGQMGPIVAEWNQSAPGKAKAALFKTVAQRLSAKKSTPYTPTSRHDFMHNKVLVVDDAVVATGSPNFSANATGNAENSITFHRADLADQYITYISALETTYH